jgi:trehalose 6-phosphate synthase/phosphatase
MADKLDHVDMFRSLRACDLSQDVIFSVTVGASSKQTLATWHLLEPADVIAAIGMLNDCELEANGKVAGK